MYIYICVCISLFTNKYDGVNIHIYICIYIYLFVCLFTHMYIYIYRVAQPFEDNTHIEPCHKYRTRSTTQDVQRALPRKSIQGSM